MSKYFMLRNSLDISEEDTQSGIIQSMYKLLLRIKKIQNRQYTLAIEVIIPFRDVVRHCLQLLEKGHAHQFF